MVKHPDWGDDGSEMMKPRSYRCIEIGMGLGALLGAILLIVGYQIYYQNMGWDEVDMDRRSFKSLAGIGGVAGAVIGGLLGAVGDTIIDKMRTK